MTTLIHSIVKNNKENSLKHCMNLWGKVAMLSVMLCEKKMMLDILQFDLKIFPYPFADGSGITSADESSSSGDNSMYSIPEVVEEIRETPACPLMSLNSDDDSDIEVLVGQSVECLLQSAMRWEDDVSDSIFFTRTKETGSDQSVNNSVGRWESEGGACAEEPAPESLDDYVVLDGYESDVDSESTDELYQSL